MVSVRHLPSGHSVFPAEVAADLLGMYFFLVPLFLEPVATLVVVTPLLNCLSVLSLASLLGLVLAQFNGSDGSLYSEKCKVWTEAPVLSSTTDFP